MSLFVITGASQGIGAAIAEVLAEEPMAQLALLARNREKLEAVARRCLDKGALVGVYPCDVTDESAVAEAAEAILGEWGAPEVLVNNAGAFVPGNIFETTLADFRTQVDVNLTSAFVVTQAFLPAMVKAGGGSVFYMGSIASMKAYPGGLAYCAAKHGLLGLARAVRADTLEHNVRVTALLPGATLTPSWEGVDLPEERFMPAEDIARAVRDVYRLTDRTVIEELILRPQLGDI